MYTYIQAGCKKVNTVTYVHKGGVSNAYSRIRTARARVHDWVGTEKLRRRRGGNEKRCVHREATERVGANRLGRNSRWKRGLAYRRTEETALCSTDHVRNGILFIGRGLAYCKTEEMDLLRSKRGSCSSGGVWRTAKRDSTGYCSSPPSTPSSLHELLFIHRRPPPASTGSCSSSLHRALLHRLLFNHPSTVYCSSSPPHHGVLFNHPSMGTPLPSTIHPALHTTGSYSSRGNATAHCSSKTPRNAHCSSQRQHRSASVSSSSKGIARSGSVNSHRSIARVQ